MISRKAEEGQQPGKGPPVRSEKRHHHHPHPKPTEEKEKEKMQKQCSTTSHYQQNQHPFSASGDVLKRSCVASSEKEVAGSGMACGASEKLNLELFEWPRIYLSLSRKEKEDDFLIMKGTKLSQRPKKRPKNIDRTLQVYLYYFLSCSVVFPFLFIYESNFVLCVCSFLSLLFSFRWCYTILYYYSIVIQALGCLISQEAGMKSEKRNAWKR